MSNSCAKFGPANLSGSFSNIVKYLSKSAFLRNIGFLVRVIKTDSSVPAYAHTFSDVICYISSFYVDALAAKAREI